MVRPGREWLPIATGVLDDEGKPIDVATRDVSVYINNWFYSCLELYNKTVLLETLPFSGGWAEQPDDVIAVITTIKSEENRWERMEWEAEHGKGKTRT